MKKLLFFLCVSLAVALVSGKVFGEDNFPVKQRDSISASISSSKDGRVSIKIVPSRQGILRFKKDRLKEHVQEIPVFAQDEKKDKP